MADSRKTKEMEKRQTVLDTVIRKLDLERHIGGSQTIFYMQ